MHRICFCNGQWAAVRWLHHRVQKIADLHIFLQKTAINARYRACYLLNLFCLRYCSDCGHVACRTALAAAKVLVIVLVVWYAVHEHISRRVFGGVTGDLAGFCISLSELITLAAATIGGLIL